MGSTLSVSITADIVDMQTKFGVASATAKALTRDFNDLARQSAAGLLDPAGIAKLEEASRAMLEARERASELKAELRETREESVSLGEGFAEVRERLSQAFELTGIAAAIEGFHELTETINELGEKAIQLRSTADVLGLTVEQTQALEVAAEEAGVSSDVLVRASEKLSVTLAEARNGAGAAVEKLKALGVTTDDIADPNFKLINLLQLLHERLEDADTEQETHNALLQEFGSKTGLAVAALKEFDGSAEAVARLMERLHGLTKESAEAAASASAATHAWGKTAENVFTKLWFGEQKVNASLQETIRSMSELSNKAQSISQVGVNVALGEKPEVNPTIESDARARERLKEAHEEIASIELVSKADLDADKDAIAATKQASAERLAAVQKYAIDAAAFYGPNVDAVRAANRQVIAETRAYNDELVNNAAARRAEEVRAAIKEGDDTAKARLAAIKSSIDANNQYFDNAVAVHNAVESMEQTGQELQTHIYQERAKTSAQLNALVAKETQQQLAQWKFLTDGMKSGFDSALRGILSGTESVSQAMAGIFTSVLDGIISKLAEWAAEWITNLVITQTANKASAASSIAANAGVAATAAMASVAAIPFYGWAMAPEVGATTGSEAEAIGFGFFSAEGGMDIPRGMNPVVQTHAEEMILPRPIANTVRDAMSSYRGGAGGAGGRGGSVVHLHAKSGSDLITVDQVVDMLRKANQRFVFR